MHWLHNQYSQYIYFYIAFKDFAKLISKHVAGALGGTEEKKEKKKETSALTWAWSV